MNKKIIYSCVFFNEKYIELIQLLLKSYKLFGNSTENIDYLIICNPNFKNKIQLLFDKININGKIWCLDLETIFEAGYSRLKIFDYPLINDYDKILYLDCDILVTNSVNKLFDIHLENKLYVLKEGNTSLEFWGSEFFKNNPKIPAFTSGILLFNNNTKIKELFFEILVHINNHLINNLPIPICIDQPFICYHAIKNNLYDNKSLFNLVVNNPNLSNIVIGEKMVKFANHSICHFPGWIGDFVGKDTRMKHFFNNTMFNISNITSKNIPRFPLINKCKNPCIKNKTFPLIGICVSYQYIDTLKFMLPINYNHFEKIYLVTQKNDIETINFCKNYNNVEVLFFDFKNNGKIFDKFGALNFIQKLVYEKYPNHWYLNIDSDIILPNNFIDILEKENLNKECIYGGIRNNILNSSELLLNQSPDYDWEWNNIVKECHNIQKNSPPNILGCFQLYFKKDCYHGDYIDAGWGDYHFGYNNFNLFCNLENIVYLHLGNNNSKNWKGKKDYFIDDCNINLNQMYFNCNIKCKNIYYDKNRNIVNLKEINKSNSINIFQSIWTCSDEFREDIKDFFKDKHHFKIAEIGSHKGYTTRYLSDIFETVYPVDNSIEWTNFNKNLNKDKKNIEYIHLDIYNNSWNVIPEVDVVFIDADHSYDGVKSDMNNSLKRFKNLKYIIFDDYGVWPGVKKLVDESLNNKTLIFEKYIGLNNVPGLENKLYKNTSEAIICKVNNLSADNIINPLVNKEYTWENSTITFLENQNMNAFGHGKYKSIDTHLIKCDFGFREHLLKFNKDYSSFISVRKDDFETVIGNRL